MYPIIKLLLRIIINITATVWGAGRGRNPRGCITQQLLGYTAEFTSKIKHGGRDMTASPAGEYVSMCKAW